MDQHAQFALLKQDFGRLLSIHDPASVDDWQPSETQRLTYGRLLERVLNGIDAVQSFEKRQVLREGHTQSYIPDTLLAFYRDLIRPHIGLLKRAYRTIDPSGAQLYELLEGFGAPRGAGGRVKATFEEGLQQIYQLMDRNPDLDEGTFLPDTALEFMDSKLIGFDPDSWLDRAGNLIPIRTDRKNVLLPVHVRLRMEEIFRAYVFGCWLSVLALSRAVLEYSILDNLHKFNIDRYWPLQDKNGKRREKKLEHLIDEISPFLPNLVQSMDKLRHYGNDYLHPKKSEVSKGALLQREQAAKDALETLIEVTEALYLARKMKV